MTLPAETLPQHDLLFKDVNELTFLWKIERVDGVALHFTAHDRTITYEGQEYSPVSSGEVSAETREAGLKGGNKTYTGFIDSVLISHDDLLAGLYDEARMTELIISWRYPWAGPVMASIGWIAVTSYGEEQWTVEIEDVTRFLRSTRGRSYSADCDFILGGKRCRKDLTSVKASGSPVNGVVYDATVKTIYLRTNGTNMRTMFDVNSTGIASGDPVLTVDGFYEFGRVLWRTGLNKGITREVKLYTGSQRTVELQAAVPFDIAVSDEFTLEVGCDRRFTTCRDKFENLLRFGGFPYIPGVYYMIQQPTLQTGNP